MPCLIVLLAAAFPRLAIAALFLFSHYLDRAYHSMLVLLLGFLFLPLSTIVYAWMVNGNHAINGVYLVALIVAALFDLGLIGHSEYTRRRN